VDKDVNELLVRDKSLPEEVGLRLISLEYIRFKSKVAKVILKYYFGNFTSSDKRMTFESLVD